MKAWKKSAAGILFLFMFFFMADSPMVSAQEEYTYTVRLYAGNQGELGDKGIEIVSDSANMVFEKDCITISGLKYGDTVYIRPQDTARTTDARYYVRGVRRSGRDNSEAESPAFHVACDRDYVVAYGISGDLVAYRVNYLGPDGQQVMASDTYYGNIGERQFVSARYVEGYQPQSLNIVKTLSANEAENVFDFRYVAVRNDTAAGTTGGTGGTSQTGGTGSTGQTGGTSQTGGTEGTAQTGGTGGTSQTGGTGTAGTTGGAGGTAQTEENGAEGTDPETDTGTEPAADTETDPEPEEGEEIPDNETPLGGDFGPQPSDTGAPENQQEILDDGEVPLALPEIEKSGVLMGYFPIYAGIGVVDVLILAGSAIFLKKRGKAKAAGGAEPEPEAGLALSDMEENL